MTTEEDIRLLEEKTAGEKTRRALLNLRIELARVTLLPGPSAIEPGQQSTPSKRTRSPDKWLI